MSKNITVTFFAQPQGEAIGLVVCRHGKGLGKPAAHAYLIKNKAPYFHFEDTGEASGKAREEIQELLCDFREIVREADQKAQLVAQSYAENAGGGL